MVARTPPPANTRELTLAKRREFLKLPLAERRQQLESQAERMMEAYASASESRLRAEWQGGDIVEF